MGFVHWENLSQYLNRQSIHKKVINCSLQRYLWVSGRLSRISKHKFLNEPPWIFLNFLFLFSLIWEREREREREREIFGIFDWLTRLILIFLSFVYMCCSCSLLVLSYLECAISLHSFYDWKFMTDFCTI